MPTPAIFTDELTRDFDTLRAIDHLSLVVESGSVYGVLGPSGAGKTTLLRLLLGLLMPTSGSINVLGYPVPLQADIARSRTGVLLEATGLYDRLSAVDNLDLFARIWHIPADERKSRTRELLQHFGLWERRNERVDMWSPGMKRTLAIARALVHRPSLLLLDEPMSGLDATAQSVLRSDLMALTAQEGVSVLLATKDAVTAGQLCQRVAILRSGQLLAEDSVGAITRLAGGPQVRIAGRGFNDDMIALVRRRQDVRRVWHANGYLLVELVDELACAAIVNLLVESGADVEAVEHQHAGLEAAYRALLEGADEKRPVG
ncbi:MAG: ABC transporter ATP-binding protein [Caldilineaceae bacterium]|nr:ABC transporter ATP-binding protein [Caldilineaceae bacterium]